MTSWLRKIQIRRVTSPFPAEHIGGYTTASTQTSFTLDTSFANYGANVGTNLRMIEGIWEVSEGITLVDAEDTTYASSLMGQSVAAPRFVPDLNPNFYVGQGQSACIACHGGGLSAMAHGYAAVANVFDYSPGAGLSYLTDHKTTAFMKSLGSTAGNRSKVLLCNQKTNPLIDCNPTSPDVDANQGWDLSSWKTTGLLDSMGWAGPITGNGLNALGVAIGQSSGVYEFLTKRVVAEVCPTGEFTAADVKNIANLANPYAIVPGTDDIATIVAAVASNSSCL